MTPTAQTKREPPGHIIGFVLDMLALEPMTAAEITAISGSDEYPPFSFHSVWAVLRRLDGREVVRAGERRQVGPGRPQLVWRLMTDAERGRKLPEAAP